MKSSIQRKIEKSEKEIARKKAALAKLRLNAERKPVRDYELLGPGNNYCSLWDLFDLLPKDVNGWSAKLKY